MFCTGLQYKLCMYHVLHLYMFCIGATKDALCATGSKLSKPSGSTTGPPAGRNPLSYLNTSILPFLISVQSFFCKRLSKPSGSTTQLGHQAEIFWVSWYFYHVQDFLLLQNSEQAFRIHNQADSSLVLELSYFCHVFIFVQGWQAFGVYNNRFS